MNPPETASRPETAKRHTGLRGPLPRSCTELRSEIERKIRANGVPQFTLTVIPTAEAESLVALGGNGAEIVGHCSARKYRVVYRRG